MFVVQGCRSNGTVAGLTKATFHVVQIRFLDLRCVPIRRQGCSSCLEYKRRAVAAQTARCRIHTIRLLFQSLPKAITPKNQETVDHRPVAKNTGYFV